MKEFNIAFDFDMTLVDTSRGIIDTTKAVLSEFSPQMDDAEKSALRTFGLPLKNIFIDFVPLGMESQAISRFMDLYPTIGVAGSTLVPEVVETLTALGNQGHTLSLISAKSGINLNLMLGHHGLSFECVISDVHGTEKSRHMVDLGVDLYVGDQESDVAAARAAGCKICIIRTNFNADIAMWETQPDFIIDQMNQLLVVVNSI